MRASKKTWGPWCFGGGRWWSGISQEELSNLKIFNCPSVAFFRASPCSPRTSLLAKWLMIKFQMETDIAVEKMLGFFYFFSRSPWLMGWGAIKWPAFQRRRVVIACNWQLIVRTVRIGYICGMNVMVIGQVTIWLPPQDISRSYILIHLDPSCHMGTIGYHWMIHRLGSRLSRITIWVPRCSRGTGSIERYCPIDGVELGILI